MGAVRREIHHVRLGIAHARRDAAELLGIDRHRERLDELAARSRHVGLELLADRLADRIVDVDHHPTLEAAVLGYVRHQRAHLEVRERDHVPEIGSELREVRSDRAAVDRHRLGALGNRRDRLRHAGERREHVGDLLDVDELVHHRDALLGQCLAVFRLDHKLAVERLVGVGVVGREARARHEQIAIGRIRPAHREHGADPDVLGVCGAARHRDGQRSGRTHYFAQHGHPPSLLRSAHPRPRLRGVN